MHFFQYLGCLMVRLLIFVTNSGLILTLVLNRVVLNFIFFDKKIAKLGICVGK